MPLVKQHTWAQAAGKGLNAIGNGPSISSSSEMENDQDNNGSSASKVIRMEENVSESQVAAAFSEGWGQRGINQDTAWEVPSSPHLSPKEGSTWTNSTSTGTEIWENNVRHHVKSAAVKPPSQMREPWGHTPSTHLGGTWGEEEDNSEWTGVTQIPDIWPNESNTTVWGANAPAESGKNWANQSSSITPNMNPNWANEPPALQHGLPHMPLASENKNLADESSPDNAPPWADPSHKASRSIGNWSPVTSGNKKMPPSGWEETAVQPAAAGTNYDDGTAVWGNPVHQGKVSHWKEMPPAKQMPNCVMPPGNMCQGNNQCPPHAGPGMIRLPQAGTTLNKADAAWVKNQSMNRNLAWNEVPSHRDPAGRKIWDDNNPLGDKSVPGTPNTPNSAFLNWGEPGHPMGPYWAAKSKNANFSWADGQVDTSSWGGPMKQGGKPLTKDLIWASKQFRILAEMSFKKDDIEAALRRSNMNIEDALMELHALTSKDNSMVDIEGLSSMNLNQPRVHLGNVAADDINFSDHSIDNSLPSGNLYGNNNFQGMNMFSTGFNVAQNCKNQNSVGNNIAPNVLSNAGANNQVSNFNLNSGNNLSPAMMRKLLQQTQTFNPACLPQNTGRMTQQNFPSTSQLRHLVQQIQMAVQAGHLNPTILNQPLAPQTLQLLFQLLQQIRFLHQLQQQQMYFSQHGTKPGSPPMQLSVQITQAKQHIVNLQNQIAAQQALFLKQQVQLPVQHPSLQNPQPSTFDVVKANLESSINGLHSEFRDLSVKEPTSQGHSRLTQWKLSSFEKDENPTPNENNGCNRNNGDGSNEFSRAPGSITKSSSANSLASTTTSHSASNLQPLNENTWGEMSRPPNDSWSDPSDSNNSVQGSNDAIGNLSNANPGSNKHNSASDNKDSPATSSNPSTSSSSQSYNLNDLVPEFEPGKPWKGTSRIKNFEDDPHVTPGSIAKSPLSLNSIKDSDLYSWTTKQNVPNLSTSSSLTSSTWTYSPPPSSQNSDSSSGRSGNSRSLNNRFIDQERLTWKGGPGAPNMPKTSRPPPGLSSQNKPITSNWMGNESTPQTWSSPGWEKQCYNFLVLKNLTPQIDGSTLKTLCLQHGPLQLFHLLLNHGIAVVRYSTREETEKARSALNNCVLSNTTILVDIPTEMEVKQYLQLANGQVNSSMSWPSGNGSGDSSFTSGNSYPSTNNAASNGGGSSSKLGTANWNSTSLNLQDSMWSYSGSGNGVWPMQSSSTDHDQCIPSSLNSFLPGDLLGGGESI